MAATESSAGAGSGPDESKEPLARKAAIIGAGMVLAGAIGFVGYLVGRSDGDTGGTAAGGVTSAVEISVAETTTTTEAPRLTTTTVTPSTTTSVEPAADPQAADPQGTEAGGVEVAQNRVARLKGGVLTLEGVVPSVEIGNETAARAAAILGEANVINNYTIDPTIAYLNSGPLVVEDRVLFASGSATINAEFTPLLDLGTALLTTFPNVTITIVAHTDAVGDEAMNLALSQVRGDTVAAYWTSRGIDPARITIDARGEGEPLIATEGPERENRRVEFIITGLLD